MTADTTKREQALAAYVEGIEPDSIPELVGYRFVAVETTPGGKKGESNFAHGHHNIRAACDALAQAMKDGARPEFILDLDVGEKVEIELHSAVTPKRVEAVIVILPAKALSSLIAYVGGVTSNASAKQAFDILAAARRS